MPKKVVNQVTFQIGQIEQLLGIYGALFQRTQERTPDAVEIAANSGGQRMKKLLLITLISVLILGMFFLFPNLNSLAAEKLKFATALKLPPHNSLPPLAAEEKGFWKAEGLEVEWVPFEGGTEMARAMAARAVEIGATSAVDVVLMASRGIPTLMVADQGLANDYFVFVRADSPIKEVRGLRGARIGVPRLGSVAHAYGQVVGRVAGVDRELRFVSTGGIPHSMAALKAGAIDAILSRIFSMAPLYYAGEIKGIVPIRDYIPREWMEGPIAARKEFVEKSPELIRRVIKAYFQATDFIMKDRSWALEKMKSHSGYSEETARGVYEILRFSKDGRIERKAVENVRNFLLDYGLVARDKTPPAEALYTNDFVG